MQNLAKELRVGNILRGASRGLITIITSGIIKHIDETKSGYQPVVLTDEWMEDFGYTIISENSAGIVYGVVINGVFDSELTIIKWKTTKNSGKFFRRDLEVKYVHQLQNIYFSLKNEELDFHMRKGYIFFV